MTTRAFPILFLAFAVGCSGQSPPKPAADSADPPVVVAVPPAADVTPGPGPLLTPDKIPTLTLHRVAAGERVPRYSYPESYRPLHHGPTPAPEPIPILPVRKPVQVSGDLRFLAPGSTSGAIALSPDGKRLASGSCIFDAATGALDAAYDVGGSTTLKLAFSPDGSLLYAGEGTMGNYPTHGGYVAVRDIAAKQQLLTIQATDWGLSGDDLLLVTLERVFYDPFAGKPGPRRDVDHHYPAVRIYDTKTWAGVAAYRVLGARPTAVALSPDGTRIVIGCDDGAVRVWDRAGNREVAELRELCGTPFPTHLPIVHQIAFSPDGNALAAANARPFDSDTPRDVAWWRWPDGKPVHCKSTRPYYDPTDLRFSPDNRFLFAGIPGGATVWDAATGEVRTEKSIDKHKRAVPFAAFAAPDRVFVQDGGRPGRLAFPSLDPIPWPDPPFQASPPEPPFATVEPMPPKARLAHPHPGYRLPDGGRVRVLRPFDEREAGFEHVDASGKRVRHYEAGRTGGYAVSPDGRVLVTCASASGITYRAYDYADSESPVRFWELATGRELGVIRAYPAASGRLLFSPDGKRIVMTHSDGLSRVWDVATRKPLVALDPVGYWCDTMSFSADGRSLVAGGHNSPILLIWDVSEIAR